MKYELCPDAVLVTVLEESMLVAVDSRLSRVESMRGVNETGAYYWRLLEKNMDTEEIIRQAMEDYGISEEEARPSFTEFFLSLRDAGYLKLIN